MWPLKTILYFFCFWAACIAALSNPIWGILNYMVAYQTDPTDAWWGLPLVDIGMRFSLIAAIFTVLGLFTGQRHVPTARPALSRWEWGVIALLMIGALNIQLGHGFGSTARTEFEKFWKVLVFTLILCRLGSRRDNLRMVLWCLVAGSLYLGWDAYHAPAWAFILGRLEMIGGPDFSTTSGAAAHLSAMLPLIGACFLIARNWKWKFFAAVAGGFTVNAIIMCRTRSAFIGLVVGTLVAFLVAPRARRFRIHAMLVAGLLMAFSLTDDNFWNRMNTLRDQELLDSDLATVSRREIWAASMHILADHPLGIGVGNFTQVIGQYDPRHYRRSTHNSLIVCFVELGVQGGIVFLIMVVGSLWMLYRAVRLSRNSPHRMETVFLAYGLLISFVTYFVTALGTQRFYCESFWWVLAMPLCLCRAVENEVREGFILKEGSSEKRTRRETPVDEMSYAD